MKATWDASQAMLRESGLANDDAYALSMVSQELLENAVKYGSFASGDAVSFEIRVSDEYVTIEVRSPVGETGESALREFDQMVQWVRSFADPFEAYVERMRAVSSQPYAAGKSGLGLARIAYEGRCLLDFYVDESSTLAVSAVFRRAA
ncbi:MAG TPA: hypothetical protein VLS93_18680 [Anaeromyxobacteraceae bacterium]|nr:hypothetical protein [Anaeromyxobacteraceae bacterium]